MAKLVVEPLPGESKKEAKKRAKQEQKLRKLERARWERIKKRTPGFDEDIDALVEEAVEKERRKRYRTPPPQLEAAPPEQEPEAWEQGGMVDGTYMRQSTVDIEKVEAHLDSLAEVTSQQAIAKRYKDMFGEDLSVPEGYELVPERRVRRRGMPAPEEEAAPAPSPEAVAVAYGEGAAPPQPMPAPPPPAPVSYTLPHLVQQPGPAAEAVSQPPDVVEEALAPAAEAAVPAAAAEEAPATEVVVGAPAPEAAPAIAPTSAPEAAPVAAPTGPVVAGAPAVAGAAAPQSAAAAAATPAPAPRPPIEKPRYKFLDMRRYNKIGYNAYRRGGGVIKLIVVLINLPLYIVLFFPIGVIATIVYVYTAWKVEHDKEKERQRQWAEQHPEEAYYDEGYGEGYEEGNDQPYAAEEPGEEGSYDEGYASEEDAYGY
jgi:hypothetical protein